MQYTPQLALNIGQAQHNDRVFNAELTIKNVGSITIYNAEVTAATAKLAPDRVDNIWGMLHEPDRGVTLGPTEVETLTIADFMPTPEERKQIEAGNLVIVMAGRIQYTDDLGREHKRYVCGQAVMFGERIIGKFCPTPEQN
jgi:hypothetical protein